MQRKMAAALSMSQATPSPNRTRPGLLLPKRIPSRITKAEKIQMTRIRLYRMLYSVNLISDREKNRIKRLEEGKILLDGRGRKK